MARLGSAKWGFRGLLGKSGDCRTERDKALKQKGQKGSNAMV